MKISNMLKKKGTVGLTLLAIALIGAKFSTTNYSSIYLRSSSTTSRYLKNEFDDYGHRKLRLDPNSEGYYTAVGNGQCLDPGPVVNNGVPSEYDRAIYVDVMTFETCAKLCGLRVLYLEHRGLYYNDDSNECHCLYDDDHLPYPLVQKIKSGENSLKQDETGEFTTLPFTGIGRVTSSVGGTDIDGTCYRKTASPAGPSLSKYLSKDCTSLHGGDGSLTTSSILHTNIDVIEHCSDRCIRFHLLLPHVGFAYSPISKTCECIFEENEVPRTNRILGSGGTGIEVSSFTALKARVEGPPGSENTMVCYARKPLSQAPVENRISEMNSQYKVWINEFHYRNKYADQPFIELIGPASSDADGYEVLFYMGRNGALSIKGGISLTGKSFTEGIGSGLGWGFLTLTDMESNDIRAGKEGGDAIALVRNGMCLQFISYGHGTNEEESDISFVARDGPCEGKSSTPIYVHEPRTTPETHSLQLTGTGNKWQDFEWNGPMTSTMGEANTDQTLTHI